MTQKKDSIDSFFDLADRVVDGAAKVLQDMPEPDSDDDSPPSRVIDVPERVESKPATNLHGILTEGQKKPREVILSIKNVSKRRKGGGGVNIIAETMTHDLVCVVLSEGDWKKICDSADWLRMVEE